MSEESVDSNAKFNVETILIADLKKHPRNYREHPDDQLKHIINSIEKNGIYKNIVIAKDNTILAGHGVVKALEKMGVSSVPVIRLNIEPSDSEAIKILVGDNEIGRLVEVNDIELTNLLKELRDKSAVELVGTGYDEMMLANLVMITRPASEIRDLSESAEWVGMTDFKAPSRAFSLVVNFRSEEDKKAFFALIEQNYTDGKRFVWWPKRDNEDTGSLKFE